MPQILLCKKADEELEALYALDEDAAALFDVLIEELSDDPVMLDHLCVPANHFKYAPPFDVEVFEEAKKQGKNIYRIKVRNEEGSLLPWRMLVGFHSQKNLYYVLAVTEREHSYDTKHPDYRELLVRYEQAGIPDYR